jgi:hypothetical protein
MDKKYPYLHHPVYSSIIVNLFCNLHRVSVVNHDFTGKLPPFVMNVDILEKKIKDMIDICRQIDFLKETKNI